MSAGGPSSRPGPDPAGPDAVLAATLAERGLDYRRHGPGAFFVTLPGEHKLATGTWLVAGPHSLLVEAFFCRRPDENAEGVYRFLLARNAKMYGVAFAIDEVGDVFLVGRHALSSVTPQELDRLLGCVLSYADECFDRVLELGFAGSIRREWAWRRSRGESTANLAAFARFADPEPAGGSGGGPVAGPGTGADAGAGSARLAP